MHKTKASIGQRIIYVLTYHPWLKLLSLILAIILWLYVKDELGSLSY
jgi:hypothetical protein